LNTSNADVLEELMKTYLLNGLVKPIFNPVLMIGMLPTPRLVMGSFKYGSTRRLPFIVLHIRTLQLVPVFDQINLYLLNSAQRCGVFIGS